MKKPKALLGLFGVLTIMASMTLSALPSNSVYAAPITSRSLTLEVGTAPSHLNGDATVPDGGSTPSGVADHFFQFILPQASGSLGSVAFQYCTTAADVGAQTCSEPHGMVTKQVGGTGPGVTGIDENGSSLTGWSLDNNDSTEGRVVINRTVATVSAATTMAIQLQNVTNTDGTDCQNFVAGSVNCTFFVRISSYTSTDGTGTPTDTGTVAAAVNNQVKIKGTMPESLVFCTGDTIPLAAGVPDCTNATNNLVSFDKLFSPTTTATATSQMSASTNAGTGYAITANGPTLTSGTNTVKAINQANEASYDPTNPSPYAETSKYGISQFGLNVVANAGTEYTNAPAVGAAINPASGTGNFNGQADAATGYGTAGSFKYNAGDVIANSNSTYSDAQIYTISYIVNVPGSLAAGDYQTTMTYICTPTF